MNEKHWAVRRVRKGGLVKIGCKWYHPEEQFLKYDGRLDGLEYAFGRYFQCDKYLPFIACWGTAAAFKGLGEVMKGPEIVDGTIPWYFWNEAVK